MLFRSRIYALENAIEELRRENGTLKDRLQAAEQALSQLSDAMQTLRRELGCA